MRVLRMAWVGIRTESFDETVALFRDVLGLRPVAHEDGFDVLAVADGSTVEVFGPASAYNRHLTSPVAGFEVDDLAEAERELRHAGAEIVLPPAWGGERAWLHFRAPDGHLYELMQDFTRE